MAGNVVKISQGLISITADTTVDDTQFAPQEAWSLPPQAFLAETPSLILTKENADQVGRQGIRVTLAGPLPGVDFVHQMLHNVTNWDLEWVTFQGSLEPVPLVWTLENIKDPNFLNNLYFPLPASTARFRLVATEPGKLPVRYPYQEITTDGDLTLANLNAILSDNVLSAGHEKYLMQIDWAAAQASYVEIVQQAALVFNQATGNGATNYPSIPGYTYSSADLPYAKDIAGPPETQQLRYALLDLYFIRSLWADPTVSTDISEPVVHALYPSQYISWMSNYSMPAVPGRPTLYERWSQFYTQLDLLRTNIRYRMFPPPRDWVINTIKSADTPHPLDPIKGQSKVGSPVAGNSFTAAEWVLTYGSKDWPSDVSALTSATNDPGLINLLGQNKTLNLRWVRTDNSTYWSRAVSSERISPQANRDFSSSDNWTKGSGWSVVNYQLKHTPGGGTATATLGSAYTSGFVVGHCYRIAFDFIQFSNQWASSESLSVSLGGYSINGLNTNIGTTTADSYYWDFVATSTAALTLTPTSGWNGAIDNISITEITWDGPHTIPPPVVGQNFINCEYIYPAGTA